MISKRKQIKNLCKVWSMAIVPVLIAVIAVIVFMKGLYVADFLAGMLFMMGLLALYVAIGMTWEKLGLKMGVHRGKDWSELSNDKPSK